MHCRLWGDRTIKSRQKRKSESESITFRIPGKVLNQLRQESQKKQVSLNTLTNQIFTDHVVWHTYAKQIGLFYVSKPFISSAANELTEEQLSSIAKDEVKRIKDLALLIINVKLVRTEVPIVLSYNMIWVRIMGFC